MITDCELEILKAFDKEDDGTYSDRYQFTIVPTNLERTHWNFYLISEISDEMCYVKSLVDINDLKNLYYAIRNIKLT